MRAERLLRIFDDYVRTLRLLTRRYIGTDRLEDLPGQLAPDWPSVKDWYTGLSLFELWGIRASGYPAVFANAGEAEYATPEQFTRLMAGITAGETAAEWRSKSPAAVELDPRYVAFRTIYDWIVLNAKVLADGYPEQAKIHDRVDPFEQELPAGGVDEIGDPRFWLHRGISTEWSAGHFQPGWRRVKTPFWALAYFFHQGMTLTDRLRYGALRERDDPRVMQVELLRPEVFVEYVTGVLLTGVSDDLIRRWKSRPPDELERDPRYVAHRCGFDRQMILYMCEYTAERGGSACG